MTSQTATHTSHPRPSRPRWWRRRGTHAAALSLALTLTAAAASSLAATPAWAASGFHIAATIRVGGNPFGVRSPLMAPAPAQQAGVLKRQAAVAAHWSSSWRADAGCASLAPASHHRAG